MAAYIGSSVLREEDRRLTTGRGRYVSDVTAPGMLHMALLRSPHAHARIKEVHTDEARRMDGVFGVYAAADLQEIMRPLPVSVPDPRLTRVAMPYPLAVDVVRYVGEPVACVLATSRYLAEDALERIRVVYERLPAVVDPEDQGAAVLHDGWDSNEAAQVGFTVGDAAAAFEDAHAVVSLTLRLHRVVGHPMEPRGVFAAVLPDGTLDVTAATQGPHSLRTALAKALGLPPERIRVHLPDIGGGFGVKNRIYPEDVLAAHLALVTGRPVRWAGDRREEFLATNQERDQIHRASLALDAEGRILAVRNDFIHDTGAYTTAGLIVPSTTAICLPGPYRVPNAEVRGRVVVTNKVPVGPYRGAGRPQAATVMERLLDRAADALGLDRVEIRRRNLIHRDEMPYDTGVPGRGEGTIVYDDGDYPSMMATVVEEIGYGDFEARREAARREGRRLGVGVANYVEISSGPGFEDARLSLGKDGRVVVRVGTSSQGQGHKTMIAQIAAERFGVRMDDVDVIEGDTGEIARGIGTFGSRTTVMVGNAVSRAAKGLRTKVLAAAGGILEAAPDDLEIEDGVVRVKGVPGRTRTLAEVVEASGPLEEEAAFEGFYPTYGMGSHAAVVEVDPRTFAVTIRDYAICHDSGLVVNPLLADGQVIGGTVQGLGTALLEALEIDGSGQPRNATFMDYLLPLATDMPDFRLFEKAFPTKTNPEGIKGLAEGGTIPAVAVIASAVEDAFRDAHLHLDEIPITPDRLHRALAEGGLKS